MKAVERYLHGEEVFLANYSDDLTDFHLPSMIDHFMESGKIAAFVCVKPPHTFHVVSLEEGHGGGHAVTGIQHVSRSGLYINGGYFIFRKEIFNYIREGEELVEEPFRRLVEEGKLAAYRHDGFWLPMDTFKDKQLLEDMYSPGRSSVGGLEERRPLRLAAAEADGHRLGSAASGARDMSVRVRPGRNLRKSC